MVLRMDSAAPPILVESWPRGPNTSWRWILRNRPTVPSAYLMGRSLGLNYESGNKDRVIELVELAMTSLDSPELIRDETKQHVRSPSLHTPGRGVLYAAPQDKFSEMSKWRRRRRKT